jgi:hypothetical protein
MARNFYIQKGFIENRLGFFYAQINLLHLSEKLIFIFDKILRQK